MTSRAASRPSSSNHRIAAPGRQTPQRPNMPGPHLTNPIMLVVSTFASPSPPLRGARRGKRFELHRELLLRATSGHREVDLVAHLVSVELGGNVVHGEDLAAGDAGDHVTGCDPGPVGGRALRHAGDLDALA